MMDYLNTKAKPVLVFLFSLIFLGVFSVTTLLLHQSFVWTWHWLLAAVVVMMLLAIPCHIAGRKSQLLYLVSFLFNSIASGCSVSAYYAATHTAVTFVEMLLGLVPAAAVLLLAYAAIQIYSKTKRFALTICTVLIVALLIVAVVFWAKGESQLFSFGFFSLFIALFYIGVFGVTVNHDERSVFRDISFGGFGSFIILTVVVAVILSEGDILDGADLSGGGGGKKNRRAK